MPVFCSDRTGQDYQGKGEQTKPSPSPTRPLTHLQLAYLALKWGTLSIMSAIITKMRQELGPTGDEEYWATLRAELDELAQGPIDNSGWLNELVQRVESVPLDDWDGKQTDLAINHDHYLYGPEGKWAVGWFWLIPSIFSVFLIHAINTMKEPLNCRSVTSSWSQAT
jgi:hypothetical protein